MHGELAGLAEGACASLKITLKRFLLSVDVGVLLEVLCQGESLEAEDANVLLDRRVGGDVSSEGEACGVGLVAALYFALIRSLHRNRIVRFYYSGLLCF